jgi:hypothetical protein
MWSFCDAKINAVEPCAVARLTSTSWRVSRSRTTSTYSDEVAGLPLCAPCSCARGVLASEEARKRAGWRATATAAYHGLCLLFSVSGGVSVHGQLVQVRPKTKRPTEAKPTTEAHDAEADGEAHDGQAHDEAHDGQAHGAARAAVLRS